MADRTMAQVIRSGETIHWPLKVKTNRHYTTDGRAWGWVEDSRGAHIAFWEGDEELGRTVGLIAVHDPAVQKGGEDGDE